MNIFILLRWYPTPIWVACTHKLSTSDILPHKPLKFHPLVVMGCHDLLNFTTTFSPNGDCANIMGTPNIPLVKIIIFIYIKIKYHEQCYMLHVLSNVI
jgi:hypothetical protein